MTDPTPKIQIHQSHLDMVSRCGQQFRYRYGKLFGFHEKELVIPPGTSAVAGTAVHHSVHLNLAHKFDHRTLLSADDVADIARDKVLETWVKDGVRLNDEEKVNVIKTRDDTIDRAVSLARLHRAEFAPKINPARLEDPFVVSLYGFPYDLAGRIDIVTTDGDVEDTKTTSNSPDLTDKRIIQSGIYALARYQDSGHTRWPMMAYGFLVANKTPKAVRLEFETSREFVDKAIQRLKQLAQVIQYEKKIFETTGKEGGLLTPANPADWVCTKKWCGYTHICPYYSGR